MTRRTEDAPRPLAPAVERTHAKRSDIDTRPRPSSAKSPRIAAIRAERRPPDPRLPARVARLGATDTVSKNQGRPPCATVLLCRP